MTTARFTASFITMQKRAARALVRFCSEHRCQHPAMERLRECLAALEAEDAERAYAAYKAVPLGGTGHISDWKPSPLPEREDAQYADVIFHALVHYWSYAMNLMKARA
jgi:hypothetical protein